MRTMTATVGALLLLVGVAITTHAQPVVQEPDLEAGSQLIFYYDAREGFTTFVNIHSNAISADPITVQLDVWGPTFDVATKVTQTFALAPFAVRVIDIGALRTTAGLPAQQGIAVASIVNGSNQPIHIPRALMGNFTVANLATGSAWGSPAIGRHARQLPAGTDAPPTGTVVDGSTVAYQVIQPIDATLATYYNPQNLAEDHGNQILFVGFKDGVGAGAPLTAAVTNWTLVVVRGIDDALTASFQVTGVAERDLVSLLGTEANGAPGKGLFTRGSGGTENANRLIFFVQSLGTFGTGYLLPTRR